ncbi:MAG TPA: signal peptidase II [Acidimicrobiales bacterium]|nr:signal peptidase II [Acidimicrobiales bacterium]
MNTEPGTKPRLTTLVIGVAALVVVLDQLTKWWALRALDDRDIDLFWTLRLHLVENSGAAFSLAGGRGGLVALLAIAVVIALIAFGRAIDTKVGAVALGLVLGGAAGNILDRVFRDGNGFLGGAVIDFVDLQWWPVFNVADAAVTIGGLIIVFVVARAP